MQYSKAVRESKKRAKAAVRKRRYEIEHGHEEVKEPTREKPKPSEPTEIQLRDRHKFMKAQLFDVEPAVQAALIKRLESVPGLCIYAEASFHSPKYGNVRPDVTVADSMGNIVCLIEVKGPKGGGKRGEEQRAKYTDAFASAVIMCLGMGDVADTVVLVEEIFKEKLYL